MKKNRWIALMLAAVMIAGLMAGCGKDNQPVQEKQFIYEPTYFKFSDNAGTGNGSCVYGDRIYFPSYKQTETTRTDENGNDYTWLDSRQVIQSVKLDGTDLQELSAFQPMTVPEGMEGNSNINGIGVDSQGNVWVLEYMNSYTFNLPDNFNPETDDRWNYYVDSGNQIFMRKLDSTGAELLAVSISEVMKGLYPDDTEGYYYWVNSFAMDKEDNIYIMPGHQNVLVLDTDGNLVANIQDDNMDSQMIRLSDGTVAVTSWTENGGMLRPVNLTTKSVEEGFKMPMNINNLYNGSEDYLYYYDTSSAIFGVKKDAEPEKLLDWLNTDVDQNYVNGINILSFDKIVALENNWDDNTSSVVVLNRTEVTPENQRTVLTMAVMWLSYETRRSVINFNRTNKEYRIQVQDYSEYNTEDNYTAGQQKLMTEIISGNVPDILSVDNMPVRQYGAKGLLEDLTPYIEKDTELGGMDGLVRPVVEAMMEDGKLYYVGNNFYLSTAVASKQVVGDATGWTIDEMRDALNKLPEGASIFSPYITQDNLLRTLLRYNLGSYINWETGECTFDQGDFAKLLEFSAMAPKTVDDDVWSFMGSDRDRLKQGKQLLFSWTVTDVWDLMSMQQNFGGMSVATVGFPAEDRHGNSFVISNGIAMSAKCKHKDAAWEFVRTVLLPKDDVWGFTVNKKNFDKLIKDAMTEDTYIDENGVTQKADKFGYWDEETGQQVAVYAMSQEVCDQLMDLIQNTKKVVDSDQTILDIVMDAAQAYLDGQKSSADVAAEVQSRVKLYVNEQR